MKVGSLFSGIGGMDLGLERAGMEIVWQVENDPFCQKVLKKHWPEVPCFGDIKEIDFTIMPPVDLICGGFPCQPFSTAAAGKRLGKKHNNYLWHEMLRAIEILRPAWVIGENVVGFNRIGLKQLVSDLERLDYSIACFEVPACAFGFTHRRARLWICAYTNSCRKPELPIYETMAKLSPQPKNIPTRMGRTNGVSFRMDRLRSLGNAVVPQVAEWIGKRIIQWQRENG